MNAYLDKQTVNAYLNLGKTIEVFLGRISEDKTVIGYLDLFKTKDAEIEVTFYELYDEGNLQYLDLYSFSFVDPDMNFKKYYFEQLDGVIGFIQERFKVTEVKFFNAGKIQDEYANLLMSEGCS